MIFWLKFGLIREKCTTTSKFSSSTRKHNTNEYLHNKNNVLPQYSEQLFNKVNCHEKKNLF